MTEQQEKSKKFLYQLKYIELLIKSKKEQLNSWLYICEKLKSVLNDSPFSKNIIIKANDLKAQINSDIYVLENLRICILSIIKKVPDFRYQTILELRYIRFFKWDKIAEEMNYSVKRVYQLHEEALTEVNNLYKNFTKMH